MILAKRDPEQLRVRIGFACLIVGALLLFWAWASWMYRSSVSAQAHAQVLVRVQGANGSDTTGPQQALHDRAKLARALWLFLIVGLGLVFIVLFGTYAIVRAVRRHRAQTLKNEEDSSEEPDVWQMHRLPPDDEDWERRASPD